jgi:predicted RNA-binding protein associated with RNAse of E/G family
MPVMKPSITVIKRDPSGQEVVRYEGVVLQRAPDGITLEAQFDHADVPVMHAILRRGDRFIERYYTDRWYNIFEIHAREDDRLKGWYCNIGKPAVMEAGNEISYVDLALDLWVAPDVTQTVLDENEFAALDLDTETRYQARAALEELQARFINNKEPGLI